MKMRQRWKVDQLLTPKSTVLGAGVYIRPDLSYDERSIQSFLLKERWTLVNAGIDHSAIRICKNKPFVNNIELYYIILSFLVLLK